MNIFKIVVLSSVVMLSMTVRAEKKSYGNTIFDTTGKQDNNASGSAPVGSTMDKGFSRPSRIKPDKAMSFEVQGAWLSVPPRIVQDLADGAYEEKELNSVRGTFYSRDVRLPGSDLASLNAGVELSKKHVIAGKYSGRWADHHRFPSIICDVIPPVTKTAKTFSVGIFSEVSTGEVITIGLRADNPETPLYDWYFFRFSVDWQGARILEIPLEAFEIQGKPLPFNKIEAIGFFALAYGFLPVPQTVLYLDDVKFSEKVAQNQIVSVPLSLQATDEPVKYIQRYYEKYAQLNHPFAEIMKPAPSFITGEKPNIFGSYFAFDRARYEYNPRFQPGYVSFDPAGKAYILAGDSLQYLENGKWQTKDLAPILVAWGQEQGWQGLQNNNAPNAADPMLRFDKDGDAYLLRQVTEIDTSGKETSHTKRTSLLLHSRDGLKTWKIYKLPGQAVTFEKIDGHNSECLNFPPVIVTSGISYSAGGDTASWLTVPAKKKDGSLLLPKYKIAEHTSFGSLHSGDANRFISANGNIYIAWFWNPDSRNMPELLKKLTAGGKTRNEAWTWQNLKNTEVGKTLPPIPENHPALSLSFKHFKTGPRSEMSYNKYGVPTFISVFNRETKTFKEPVFVGTGGYLMDGHNTPAISIDSKGYLHVLISGHHDPLMYTRSKRPYDATEWTDPELIQGDFSRLSYSTMVTDKDDFIYSINRTTSRAYNNSLSLTRYVPGKGWEEEKTLIWNWKGMYMVWSHKLTYDRTRNRLFLTYYSNGSGQQMELDIYEFFNFYHPDQEPRVALNQGINANALNSGRISPIPTPMNRSGGSFYLPEVNQGGILMSEDNGVTWRHPLSSDFK